MGGAVAVCGLSRSASNLWLQKKCWLGRGAASVLGVTPLVLQVMTDVEDKNEWKNCIDIAGVQLPTGYFFGASAGTGDLSGEWALLGGLCKLGAWSIMQWMQ